MIILNFKFFVPLFGSSKKKSTLDSFFSFIDIEFSDPYLDWFEIISRNRHLLWPRGFVKYLQSFDIGRKSRIMPRPSDVQLWTRFDTISKDALIYSE